MLNILNLYLYFSWVRNFILKYILGKQLIIYLKGCIKFVYYSIVDNYKSFIIVWEQVKVYVCEWNLVI